MSAGRHWTKWDIDFLIAHAEIMTAPQLAVVVNRSPASVLEFARKHQIKLTAYQARHCKRPRKPRPEQGAVKPPADETFAALLKGRRFDGTYPRYTLNPRPIRIAALGLSG